MLPVSVTLSVAEPTAPSADHRRWSVAIMLATALVLGASVSAVALSARDDEPSRQAVVARRGATVMPFDLEATTHVFDPTVTGGVQAVVADDPTDNDQIALIRSHLRDEVKRFRTGDFGDPQSIHGHDMPGIRILVANPHELEIAYRALDDGAEVTYFSADPVVVTALHDWFAAQLHDHGGDARAG